jgi:bacteriocin biosynthesis cyclodehydratase domain-containing protein
VIDRPKLHPNCRVFDGAGSLMIRGARMGFRIEPARANFVRQLLARLDGTRSIEELLSGAGGTDGFYSLRLLQELEAYDLLGPEHPQETVGGALPRLDGLSCWVLGERLADGLVPALLAAGAAARRGPSIRDAADDLGRVVEGSDPGELIVVACAGGDLTMLEHANRELLKLRRAWVPMFALGGEGIAGPWIVQGRSACFRCLELRWLALSPAVAVENAYFESLRHPPAGAVADEGVDVPMALGALARLLASEGRLSQDGPRVFVSLARGGEPELHPIERDPECEECGPGSSRDLTADPGADWQAVRDRPALSLEALGQRLAPVSRGRAALAAPLSPAESTLDLAPGRPHVVLARFPIPKPERVRGEQSNWCHGGAANEADARTIAVVECLERYCGLSSPRGVASSTYEAISQEAVHPNDLPLFSPDQYRLAGFPFVPFRGDREMEWLRGTSLTSGRRRLVPRAAVYYGVDDPMLEGCSSGVAAHTSPAAAALNATFELVERDSLMIHWLHRISPPLLNVDSLDDVIVNFIREKGYRVVLADVTTDLGVSAVLAMATRTDREGPALLVGSGSSLSPLAAARRALNELYCAVVGVPSGWVPGAAPAPGDVTSIEAHERAYAHPSWLEKAEFLWGSTVRRPYPIPENDARPSDPVRDLERLVAHLDQRGHEVVVVDITSPEVARYGLFVGCVVVPGLQPIGFGPYGIRLGGRRLYEAPVRMGVFRSAPPEESINLVPHCFP